MSSGQPCDGAGITPPQENFAAGFRLCKVLSSSFVCLCWVQLNLFHVLPSSGMKSCYLCGGLVQHETRAVPSNDVGSCSTAFCAISVMQRQYLWWCDAAAYPVVV